MVWRFIIPWCFLSDSDELEWRAHQIKQVSLRIYRAQYTCSIKFSDRGKASHKSIRLQIINSIDFGKKKQTIVAQLVTTKCSKECWNFVIIDGKKTNPFDSFSCICLVMGERLKSSLIEVNNVKSGNNRYRYFRIPLMTVYNLYN